MLFFLKGNDTFGNVTFGGLPLRFCPQIQHFGRHARERQSVPEIRVWARLALDLKLGNLLGCDQVIQALHDIAQLEAAAVLDRCSDLLLVHQAPFAKGLGQLFQDARVDSRMPPGPLGLAAFLGRLTGRLLPVLVAPPHRHADSDADPLNHAPLVFDLVPHDLCAYLDLVVLTHGPVLERLQERRAGKAFVPKHAARAVHVADVGAGPAGGDL